MTTIMAIIARVVHFIPKWWTLHLVYHLYSLHIWISIRSTSDAFFFLLNASSHWKHLSLIIMQDERCDECWMYSTNEKSKISDASRWNCLFHFQMFYLMSCASRNNAFHIHVWYMNWAYNLQVSIDNNNICCRIKSMDYSIIAIIEFQKFGS